MLGWRFGEVGLGIVQCTRKRTIRRSQKKVFFTNSRATCAAKTDEFNYLRVKSGNDLRIAGIQLSWADDNNISTAT